jgi:hypothetical protein
MAVIGKAEELKHALSSGTLPQLGRFAEEGAQRDVNRSTSMSITFLHRYGGIILLSLQESGSRHLRKDQSSTNDPRYTGGACWWH